MVTFKGLEVTVTPKDRCNRVPVEVNQRVNDEGQRGNFDFLRWANTE